MAANAYFDRLAGLGYAIKVYQTDFLDYCSSPKVESCTSYRSADLGPVATTPLPATQKTALMLYGLLSLSETVSFAGILDDLAARRLMQDGMEPPLLDLSARRRTSTIGALAAFDRLIADLRRARPGEVYFAHLLLPHYPYATDRNCAVKGIAEWQMRRSPRQAWRDRQLAYFEQLRCATSKLQAALDALAASPAGGRSIVVVHGDHGSRITRRDPIVANLARLDDQDLIGSYSTLFAVRAKGIAPGYEATRLPVARLLSALARSSFRSVDPGTGPDFEPSVVLEDEHWQPLGRHDLPASWASPETENAPGSVSDRPAPEQGPLAPTLR